MFAGSGISGNVLIELLTTKMNDIDNLQIKYRNYIV